MKKITVIISSIFLMCGTIFASDYKPSLHINPSVRQQGFGGFFTTDTTSFYGLYSNPATLGRHRQHSLFPGLSMHVAGPLEDTFKIAESVSNKDLDVLGDLIKKYSGLKMMMDLAPLFSFGHITAWGFGWGLNTQVYANIVVPGVAMSDVAAGAETVFTGGFGFPIINTDNHQLTVGITAKGFAQWALAYNGALFDFMNDLKEDAAVLPAYMSVGFGFDAGVFYSFFNRIEVAAVWKDPFGMAFTSDGTLKKQGFDFSKTNLLTPKLSAGAAFNVPVAWTNGVITSFKIMADYRNFYTLWTKGARNPILEVSAGIELVLINMFSFRFGMSEMYPSAGFGFKAGYFNLDLAMYGKELGLEPGSSPCLNASLFLGFTY